MPTIYVCTDKLMLKTFKNTLPFRFFQSFFFDYKISKALSILENIKYASIHTFPVYVRPLSALQPHTGRYSHFFFLKNMHRQIFFCFCFLQNIDASSLHYGVVFTILKNAPLINIEFSKPQPRLDLSTKPLNINSKKDGCNYSSFFLKLKRKCIHCQINNCSMERRTFKQTKGT